MLLLVAHSTSIPKPIAFTYITYNDEKITNIDYL